MAYSPPVALEEVDEDALEYEMRVYMREMVDKAERQKAMAEKAEKAARERERADNGEGEGFDDDDGGKDIESELEKRLASRRVQMDNDGNPATTASDAAAMRTRKRAATSAGSRAALLTRLRAADNARVVARSPGAILGIAAQDVQNARLWCQTFVPHLSEQGQQQSSSSSHASQTESESVPDFARLKRDRAAWVEAIETKNLEAVVNLYSLRSSMFGRWFTGEDLDALGQQAAAAESHAGSSSSSRGCVLDRGAVRTAFESLFESVDSISFALHTPAACSLQLHNHVCWRSEATVVLAVAGVEHCLEGYAVVVQQLDSGKLKGQFLDLRRSKQHANKANGFEFQSLSRWSALLGELSLDGVGVTEALECDLEENWHALVRHTDEISEMVDIENPHWESESTGFVFQEEAEPALFVSPRHQAATLSESEPPPMELTPTSPPPPPPPTSLLAGEEATDL
mmetsp:Transcript_61441/g.123153  ORF Transcript_61441/g.123153 Transcript_61441/m.123153 type:complete len:458 (+) Transcript_61441:729-2102(+)